MAPISSLACVALLALQAAASPSLLFSRDDAAVAAGPADYSSAPPSYGNNSLTGVVSEACQLISNRYPDLLYYPTNPTYTNESANYWSKTCALTPGPLCIFAPKDARGTADAVKILADTQTPFAVRGHGHTPVPGAAGIQNGVLIVMTNLNQLSMNQDRSVATVGPGLNWQQVYAGLDKYQRIVLGGRYAPVGVSGLLLGGGISDFSNRHGWAANNVLRYELVTADGRVRSVTDKSYPDLFWALKGGNNNYGIVTSFDLKAFPRNDVFAGTIVYGPDQVDPLINAIGSFVAPGGGISDLDAAIDGYITVSSATKSVGGTGVLVYNKPDPNPAAFKNFTSLPSLQSTAHVRDYSDFQTETEVFGNQSLRQSFYTIALKGSVESVKLVNQTATQAALDQFKDVPGGLVNLIFQPVSQTWLQAARDAGGDALDLDPARGNFVILDISIVWLNAADDAKVLYYSNEMLRQIETKAKAAGLYYPFLFANDAGAGQPVIASYGYGKSLGKLRDIAHKYDPSGVFQRLLPGGWKVDAIQGSPERFS